MKLHQGCLALLPPLPPPPPLLPLPPGTQQDQPLLLLLFSMFNVKTRMKAFMMTQFHLMNAKYIFLIVFLIAFSLAFIRMQDIIHITYKMCINTLCYQ